MRIEDAPPRTRLLAAVAGFMLLAWLLAVAGMGGRVEPLADDPTRLQALPPVPPVEASPSGSLDDHSAISDRPLFSPGRKPVPFFLQGRGDEADAGAFAYRLTGVIITPKMKLAIVQPADGGDPVRVQLDQPLPRHPDWRLVGLGARSAVFDGPEGERTLALRVFNGAGGERPADDAGAAPAPVQGGVDMPRSENASADAAAEAAGNEAATVDADASSGEAAEAASPDPARMDAIRARIQARRARLRDEREPASSPTQQPPTQIP